MSRDDGTARRCARDGMLVGASVPLLGAEAAPLSEEDLAAGKVSGCGRIACTRCGRAVRSFPNHSWETRPEPEELEQAWDSGDFSRFLGAKEFFKDYRAYACRCDFTSAVTPISLREVFRELDISWMCEGHPGPG